MRRLSDFKDEINKCSKCGLCQSVCPVYKETGNECAVSKGKFVMLDGVLKGDLKLNKNIVKYLDMCLKCGKCSDFCPSGIDVCKIFETAKFEYAKNTLLGKLIFFLESDLVFGNVIKMLMSLRGVRKHDVVISSELCSQSEPKYNEIATSHFSDAPRNDSNDVVKLLYFKGCVGKIFPQTEKLLKQIPNIEIVEQNFDCCGIPFLSSGNLERYEQVKKRNLELMDCEFDYILTDCASCESTIKNYFNEITTSVSRNDMLSLGELLVKQNVKFKSEKPVRVTFHKPCHLKNTDFIKPLFENCENIEYIEMQGFDECCGFAGEFALKNRKLSVDISRKKAQNILATNADFVITTCPSCIIGLKQGLFGIKNAPKVLSLSDFLLNICKHCLIID